MLILFGLNSLKDKRDKLIEGHGIGLVLKCGYNLLIKRHFNLLLRKVLELIKLVKVPNNQPTPPNPVPILVEHLFQNRSLIQLLFGEESHVHFYLFYLFVGVGHWLGYLGEEG